MAQETLQHVSEMMDKVDVNNTDWFERLWGLTAELRARVDERFPNLVRDPSSVQYDAYGAKPGEPGPGGHCTTWVGDDVDWMVHSNTGNAAVGFCNMHLTIWLGPHSPVPHLGFAFGTMPNMFMLVEFPPRCDLSVNPDQLFKYYEPMNDEWLALRSHPELMPFTSRAIYVRQVLSETPFLYTAPNTEATFELYSRIAHEALTRWFGWLDEGLEVPEAEQSAMSKRDLLLRKYSAELDPANNMAEKYYGAEMTNSLVRQLWGGDRKLPRFGGHPNA
jgi:hypothetical protein